MSEVPVITQEGTFDSQNLAFWDHLRGEYRAYWHCFPRRPGGGSRHICTATSPDFLNWSEKMEIRFTDDHQQHMYTNMVKPYDRAPHLFLGSPVLYTNRGWTEWMWALPGLEQ